MFNSQGNGMASGEDQPLEPSPAPTSTTDATGFFIHITYHPSRRSGPRFVSRHGFESLNDARIELLHMLEIPEHEYRSAVVTTVYRNVEDDGNLWTQRDVLEGRCDDEIDKVLAWIVEKVVDKSELANHIGQIVFGSPCGLDERYI